MSPPASTSAAGTERGLALQALAGREVFDGARTNVDAHAITIRNKVMNTLRFEHRQANLVAIPIECAREKLRHHGTNAGRLKCLGGERST